MKTIVFASAAYNLAETTRTIEVAKAVKSMFNIEFMSYGGDFETLIEKEGFSHTLIEPELTPEKIEHIYKVDQGQAFSYMFTREEVAEQVKNEMAFYDRLKPAAVVTGFNLSSTVSCTAAKIPLVWLCQSTWFLNDYLQQDYAKYADMLDFPGMRLLPDHTLCWLTQKLFKMADLYSKPYNQVLEYYGCEPWKTMQQSYVGDYNLLCEPDDFCEFDPSSRQNIYIGPLIGRVDTPIPQEILDLPKDKPMIYFAMGSSGQAKVIAEIIESFEGKNYYVVAPVKKHLEKLKHQPQVPVNVLVTDWLPAHKVNPMADLSVIHGGIGTVMTAALAGKPVVGVGMQPEQEYNIDCLVRKGFAIRIRKPRVSAKSINEAIDQLLFNDDAKEKASKYQKVMQKWDTPEYMQKFFKETFG